MASNSKNFLVPPELNLPSGSSNDNNNSQTANNDNLITTAENLLDNLEDVAEMLTEGDGVDMIKVGDDECDEARAGVLQKFLDGLESARNVVSVLKREKWRLSKREMSVEMRMGELEDYKSHLRSDMSSLNQTVDVLSMRVIQLENQLAEAQETQESLEAQLEEQKTLRDKAEQECAELQDKNAELTQEIKRLKSCTSDTLASENAMLKNEVAGLTDENLKLKELIRAAESYTPSEDQLARLTRDFLKELSNLDNENEEEEEYGAV